jgi:hypothetical protein
LTTTSASTSPACHSTHPAQFDLGPPVCVCVLFVRAFRCMALRHRSADARARVSGVHRICSGGQLASLTLAHPTSWPNKILFHSRVEWLLVVVVVVNSRLQRCSQQ